VSPAKAVMRTPLVAPEDLDGGPPRVGLRRLNASSAKPYPPDEDGKVWWARLKKALGTQSSDFVNASLFQLIAVARLPCSGISEMAVNAALAFVEGCKPKNEMEAALAIQMACSHGAAMMVLSRFQGGGGGDRRVQSLAHATARLLNAFANQTEAYRRLQNGSSQYMRIEHVHVGEGGKAMIGNVQTDTNRKREMRSASTL
jgi:hypothetical protein